MSNKISIGEQYFPSKVKAFKVLSLKNFEPFRSPSPGKIFKFSLSYTAYYSSKQCVAMSIAQLWYLDEENEWQLELTGCVCVFKNFKEKNHSIFFLELQVFIISFFCASCAMITLSPHSRMFKIGFLISLFHWKTLRILKNRCIVQCNN